MRAGPSQEEVRQHNLGALLRHVHHEGPTSRAVLAAGLGLNRSTILGLAGDLAAAGLVREEAPQETGRAGRPSLVVRPEPARAHVLAMDVGVERLSAALVGLGGAFLDRREHRWPAGQPQDPARVADLLAGFARDLLARRPPGGTWVGAAAAVRGLVRHPDGLVGLTPNTGWKDVDLAGALTDRLRRHLPDLPDLPVLVANEANLGALAEHRRGVGRGSRNLVYLHGEIGIGAGVISAGELLRGARGYAGEIGHLTVNPHRGRPCGCGARGCLEAEAGERALLEAAGRDGTGAEAVRSVVAAADLGDVTARAALHRVGDWLGIGIANLANLLDPDLVVLGGTLRDVYLGSAAQVRSRINTNALAAVREGLRLRVGALGDDTVLIGAAELAFADLLARPLETLARLSGR
ncbi:MULTISPECIES: ROK family transcriptional regulator [Kitasatospora]|uniref:Putative NagC family transcriptional regulator n=1 Tax=Kitasatospora setae (strain ATCC 33774 / DSM 43861 / JCM 3304 / KCC A-0304 / NBRC 14216 / KM-6054) TaxID=452652 RepID=E4NJJ9_KITSK|nr:MULTISPECIES: ROK family transcriptional regulator [Kitasatospora]BAJ33147.1 putative NagC family transcriptional regulator [Kitasatospora setae KM-6054]